MREAAAALTVLDSDALEQLAERAQSISVMSQGLGVDGKKAMPGLAKRVRSLDALLRLTSENLATLERASGHGHFGQEAFGYSFGPGTVGDEPQRETHSAPMGLFQSFGLYGDASGTTSLWPREREIGSESSGRL